METAWFSKEHFNHLSNSKLKMIEDKISLPVVIVSADGGATAVAATEIRPGPGEITSKKIFTDYTKVASAPDKLTFLMYGNGQITDAGKECAKKNDVTASYGGLLSICSNMKGK